jgi:hypothetical protein
VTRVPKSNRKGKPPLCNKLPRQLWDDPNFQKVSSAPPNAQTLYLRLANAREMTALSGLVQVFGGGIAESLGWPIEDFNAKVDELVQAGLVRCAKGWFFLPLCAILDNPNSAKGWRDAWDELPEGDFKDEVLRDLLEAVNQLEAGYRDAFIVHFPEAFPEPTHRTAGLATPSPPPSPLPSPPPSVSSATYHPPHPIVSSNQDLKELIDCIETDPDGKKESKITGSLEEEITSYVHRFGKVTRRVEGWELSTLRKHLNDRLKGILPAHHAAEFRRRVDRLLSMDDCPNWIWKLGDKPGGQVQVWIVATERAWKELGLAPSRLKRNTETAELSGFKGGDQNFGGNTL